MEQEAALCKEILNSDVSIDKKEVCERVAVKLVGKLADDVLEAFQWQEERS